MSKDERLGDAVRVSQAAREAAGHFVASRSGCESGMEEALRGVHDDTPLVQAFARFEAQAQAELVRVLRDIILHREGAVKAARALLARIEEQKAMGSVFQ